MIGAGAIAIKTPEGLMVAAIDDCIIKGVRGEFYPCKPEISNATYEDAEGAAPSNEFTRACCNAASVGTLHVRFSLLQSAESVARQGWTT